MLKVDGYIDPKVAAERRKYLRAKGWKRVTVTYLGIDQEAWLAPWGTVPLRLHVAVGKQRIKDRKAKALGLSKR